MKLVLISTLLFASNAFAANLPTRAECARKEQIATDLIRTVEERFQVGEVTRVEVNHAYIQQNEIRLSCASIVRGDAATPGSYCAQANVDLMNGYVQGTEEYASVGQMTYSDVLAAKTLQAQFEAICAK